jgi:hypothetical protein
MGEATKSVLRRVVMIGIVWLSALVIVFIMALAFARQHTSNKASGGNAPWEKEEK